MEYQVKAARWNIARRSRFVAHLFKFAHAQLMSAQLCPNSSTGTGTGADPTTSSVPSSEQDNDHCRRYTRFALPYGIEIVCARECSLTVFSCVWTFVTGEIKGWWTWYRVTWFAWRRSCMSLYFLVFVLCFCVHGNCDSNDCSFGVLCVFVYVLVIFKIRV